jgi:hypothetical protein
LIPAVEINSLKVGGCDIIIDKTVTVCKKPECPGNTALSDALKGAGAIS